MIFSFPGGESCRGFFMVSLLVEMAASSGITVSVSSFLYAKTPFVSQPAAVYHPFSLFVFLLVFASLPPVT